MDGQDNVFESIFKVEKDLMPPVTLFVQPTKEEVEGECENILERALQTNRVQKQEVISKREDTNAQSARRACHERIIYFATCGQVANNHLSQKLKDPRTCLLHIILVGYVALNGGPIKLKRTYWIERSNSRLVLPLLARSGTCMNNPNAINHEVYKLTKSRAVLLLSIQFSSSSLALLLEQMAAAAKE
ncbi:Protein of unknown function [Gryllus bimaculatus]|nr:Protein of unknown function [Gryllus bimaculatus]